MSWPAIMISAYRPSWSRRAAGALAVVMTIVRAYAGAAVEGEAFEHRAVPGLQHVLSRALLEPLA